jgi:hypothetical protein
MYLIISIVIFLISAGSMWYGTTSKNTTLIYSGLIIMISSLVSAIYFFISKPESLQISARAADAPVEAAWTNTEKAIWATWLENNIGTLTTASQSSSTPTGIKSIVVRRNNGTTAELPIMNFLKKLYTDIFKSNPYVLQPGMNVRLGLQEATQYKLNHNGRGAATLQDAPGNNGQLWQVIW